MRQKAIGLAIAALAVAGCGVASSPEPTSVFLGDATPGPMSIATEASPDPSGACAGAAIRGLLIPAPKVGFMLLSNGQGHAVIWPFGYSGRWDTGGAVLLDRSGAVVAHEADGIAMYGSLDTSGTLRACDDPRVVITDPAPQLPPLPTISPT